MVFTWQDQRAQNTPRVIVQQRRRDDRHCAQFSISISDGRTGLTVQFDDEAEFRQFWADGGASTEHATPPLSSESANSRERGV